MTPDNEAAAAAARVRGQVEDALELTNYVVKSGIKGADEQPIPFIDIAAIQTAAAKIGLLKVAPDAGAGGAHAGTITAKEWIDFEQAYYRLAMAVSPVTTETLRNTEVTTTDSPARGLRAFWRKLCIVLAGDSPATKFTRAFWYFALFFVAFILIVNLTLNILGLEADAVSVKPYRDILEATLPWAYGGLGACASLLRSAHYFIHQRTFDVRRKPEYYNRILLGAISGGTIMLFANYLMNDDDDTAVHLGSAALGFIAGYSTDFLFNTIERIVTAIFPKVAVETVPRDGPQTPRPRPARRPPQPAGNDPKPNGAKPDGND